MIRSRFFRGLPLAFATAALLAGCVTTQQRQIELPAEGASVDAGPLDCALEFNGVVDQRPHRRTRGPSGHIYDIRNTIEYLDSGIRAMTASPAEEASETAVGADEPAENAAPLLKVDLVRAYAKGKAMRGFYNVVLVAHIDDARLPVIRGQHNVTNWTSGEREFQTKYQKAIDDALTTMRNVLADNPVCRGRRADV